jgi:hypothetical protein
VTKGRPAAVSSPAATGSRHGSAASASRGRSRPSSIPDTPDALITVLEIEENLLRKELTAAEREADTLRYAAELKKLDGEKLATELPVSGSKGTSATTGGRGKKAATAKVAIKLRLSKAAVQKRIKAASAAIGEEIDLDCDTPEELERKAEKRLHAERKVVRLKRRKPAPRVDDPTPPADPHAGEIGSKIEGVWKAYNALGRKPQLRFIHDASLRLGLDPLKMAPAAAFGLADEDPDLAEVEPAEVAPATHGAAVAQSGEREDAAELGAEDLQVPMMKPPRIPTPGPTMPTTSLPSMPTRILPRMPMMRSPKLPTRSPVARRSARTAT